MSLPGACVVWYGFDAEDLVVSSQEGRLKVRNVRERPGVSLCVYDPDDPESRYVEVRGTATIAPTRGRLKPPSIAGQALFRACPAIEGNLCRGRLAQVWRVETRRTPAASGRAAASATCRPQPVTSSVSPPGQFSAQATRQPTFTAPHSAVASASRPDGFG